MDLRVLCGLRVRMFLMIRHCPAELGRGDGASIDDVLGSGYGCGAR